MPIERGHEWGTAGHLGPDARIATSDAHAASLAEGGATIGLTAGDLARTLGVRVQPAAGQPCQILAIDVITARLDDDSTFRAVAHVQIGHRFRRSPFVAIMNAAFLGTNNIAPRAHPGDGKLDVVTMTLTPADRLRAWRRMPTARHVPHPDIAIVRRASGLIELTRPLPVHVDGVLVGRAKSVHYAIERQPLMVAV